MKFNYIARAEKFSTFASKPIIFIKNPFGDEVNYWILIQQWRESNPSSHIFYNEVKGQIINQLMEHTDEFDGIRFMTKLDEIHNSFIKFSSSIEWVFIYPATLKYN